MDATIRIIEVLAKLFAVLAWPVVVFVLLRFGSSLREFVDQVVEVTLKGGGFEASAKRKQAEAAAALAAAEASRPDGDSDRGRVARDARAAATVVAEVAPPRVIRRVSGSKVLWVDDQPNNNVYPRQALEALGVDVELALSTDEALEKLRHQKFGAIISDMGRPQTERLAIRCLIRCEQRVIRRRLLSMPARGCRNIKRSRESTGRLAAPTAR